jgi:hypothetical protein
MTGILNLLLGAGGVIKDTYFNLVSLLLPGNGTNGAQNNTFLDSSTNTFTITRNGNTTQGTFSPFSQTGWGNYFGTSNNLYLNGEAGFAFGSSADFTIEFFFYTNSTSADIVFYDGRPTSTQGAYPTVYLNGTTKVVSYVTSSAERITGTTTISVGVWYHVLLSRSGGNTRLFVNGVQQGSTWPDTTNYINPASRPNIAVSGFSANGYIDGYISNFRVLNGTGFTSVTVPTTPFATNTANQVLLTCQANRFVDSNTTVTAKTINRTGSPSVQAFSPFNPLLPWTAANNGGSGYFDGSGDSLNTGSNTALALGTGDFTWEFWTYLTGTPADGSIIFEPRTPAGIDSVLFGYKSGSNYTIYATTNGSSWNLFSNTTITSVADVANRWAHWAFVRNGSTYSVYVDGVLKTSATSSSAISQATNVFTFMGGITGYLSSFRFVKAQALATGAFTIPAAPVTTSSVGWTGANVPTQSITGSVNLLLNFTNAGIYDATSKNDLETVGNAQISTSVSKFGGGSIAFDGTGDYLYQSANLLNYTYGTGDFTVEFWIYRAGNVSVSDAGVIDQRNGGSGAYFMCGINTSQQFFVFLNSAYRIGPSASTLLAQNTWYHIAYVRSGTTGTLYINGSSIGTWADNLNYVTNAMVIGRHTGGGSDFNGYIDDLRITKGYARYTSNFTPPTAAFPTL